MQSLEDTKPQLKLLGISLIVIIAFFLIAGLFNQEQYPIIDDWYPTDLLFIIIPIIAIIMGTRLVLMYKGKGKRGIAWIFFAVAITIWFVGEITYSYTPEYDINDISTFTSNIFYIIGYPLFFAFTILYLKPRKKSISKQMVFVAIGISILFLIPTLYFSLDFEEDPLLIFIYGIYPFLDSMILAPAIIAVMLFFKGKVNFLWGLILFAILFDIVGDTLYLFESISESYYPGHPVDILFLASYLCLIFGSHNNIKLFKTNPKNKNK